jgi:hypothetical protein
LLVLIVNNFIIQLRVIPQNALKWPVEYRTLPPGYRVQPLKAYLSHAPIAGYYTDSYNADYWINSDEAKDLQRSQYALSPTLLDPEHCFDHDLVVFECHKPGCFNLPMKQHGYETVYSLNDRTVLARRKR